MQGGGVSLFLVLVVHFAAVLPEILVPLHVEFHQVTHLHRVDLTRPAVTDLKDTKASLEQKFVHPHGSDEEESEIKKKKKKKCESDSKILN